MYQHKHGNSLFKKKNHQTIKHTLLVEAALPFLSVMVRFNCSALVFQTKTNKLGPKDSFWGEFILKNYWKCNFPITPHVRPLFLYFLMHVAQLTAAFWWPMAAAQCWPLEIVRDGRSDERSRNKDSSASKKSFNFSTKIKLNNPLKQKGWDKTDERRVLSKNVSFMFLIIRQFT